MYTLRGQGEFVLPTASTGIAAALYDGCRTGHNPLTRIVVRNLSLTLLSVASLKRVYFLRRSNN